MVNQVDSTQNQDQNQLFGTLLGHSPLGEAAPWGAAAVSMDPLIRVKEEARSRSKPRRPGCITMSPVSADSTLSSAHHSLGFHCFLCVQMFHAEDEGGFS
ncbi:unnamed protein product [Knipowitschia caucasica]|uniref:Uncharacterized protein n=1 Tax=Knipowitschia caucasica TaxID=637954 RepID=A0AAV2K630_KNICA